MATVQDLCTDTLVLINVVDAGGAPSTSESNHAFTHLNRLVSNWSAAGVPVFRTSKDTVALTGAASYALASRPMKIKAATVVSGGFSKALELVTSDQFVQYKDRTRTGKFGEILYADGGYPTCTVSILPIPATGGSLELFSVKELTAFGSLAATIDLPPGYEMALQFALAAAIAPSYGKALSPDVLSGAAEAKESIGRLNAEVLGSPVAAETPQLAA